MVIIVLFFLLPLVGSTQKRPDTLQVSKQDSVRIKKHSPGTATLMSALVPGLGQIYNKKHWYLKVPIIYAGLGASVYFVVTNSIEYKHYHNAYIAKVDDDPTTEDIYPFAAPQELLTYVEFYQKKRELSYIATTLVYLLNILDANVYAHLFYFDVSDDLSLHIQPNAFALGHRTPVAGFTLTLKL